MSDAPATKRSFSFPVMEREIIRKWDEEDTFQESVNRTSNGESYVFFDGPPFATGLPHHGNLLASVVKDVVPRYWTMKGRHVQRRFGWDCHGLPIEHEIDKKLGMPAHEAVEKLGVAGYNDECRSIVDRYVKEWRSIITRLGRWVDFDNDYKTMDVDFMESVWWAVKSLWDKGLIYRGNKVMPVSTALATPLSNFEASSNYMDVQDPSVTVLFKLREEDAYVAAWTTTPWTLPSNLALCVRDDIDYVRARDVATGKSIYFAAARLDAYRRTHEFEIEEHCKGVDLVGRRYQPLFPYFEHFQEDGAFVVLSDGYVTTEEGTGVVHQAPAFGEDDYRIAQEQNIEAFVCPVSMDGVFTEEVVDFAGKFVKDADSEIITWLKARDALFEQDVIQHSYPFCYRSDSPLIYRAVPSWFVRISEIQDRLIAANQKIRWVPEHMQEGRFGNWLKNAIDWAISRNRVWGTPLPIWENDLTGNFHCVGSREELLNLTGVEVEDLHREFVDHLTFQLPGEDGTYRRVAEVLDCWFESGSMPYAQNHYPFENKLEFESGFPADFIAEGLDQTRGWFYTLLALSTALYDEPAFKNVIVNGLVLAEDGKKMSKSLKNYTDPGELMDEYGADALRLYLINSSFVRGEEQRFSDAGVKDMVRRALLPWYNAYSFLELYAKIDGWDEAHRNLEGMNVLDRWILSRLQTLKESIAVEMESYRLDNVMPKLFDFIADLTNWYIRLNRSRFWGEGLTDDKIAAYSTLYLTVYELTLAMAPCAPFLAEHIYQSLADFSRRDDALTSVHFCTYPEFNDRHKNDRLEEAVATMRRVVLLARKRREEARIGLRTPLAELVVIHSDPQLLDEVQQLEHYIKAELNVKSVRYASNEGDFINWFTKPNFPVLGKRLGKRMKHVQALIRELSAEEIEAFQEQGEITLDGDKFGLDEINVFREAKPGSDVVSDSYISVVLDCTLTDELVEEGLAREVVHRIQQARKDLALNVADRIAITFEASPRMDAALSKHKAYVSRETLALHFVRGNASQFSDEIDGETVVFDIRQMAQTNA